MSSKYNIDFYDDRTFLSVPSSFAIVPGTTCTIYAEAKETRGTIFSPIDLTGCTLIAAILNSTGVVRLYQTGEPSIKITNASKGRFTFSLVPKLTQVLNPGESHTLEIKSVNSNGERRQICYAPLIVPASSLISE